MLLYKVTLMWLELRVAVTICLFYQASAEHEEQLDKAQKKALRDVQRYNREQHANGIEARRELREQSAQNQELEAVIKRLQAEHCENEAALQQKLAVALDRLQMFERRYGETTVFVFVDWAVPCLSRTVGMGLTSYCTITIKLALGSHRLG